MDGGRPPAVPLCLGDGTGLEREGGHLPPQPGPNTARAESTGNPHRASGKTWRGHECPNEGQATLSSFLQGDRSSLSTDSTQSGAGPKDSRTVPPHGHCPNASCGRGLPAGRTCSRCAPCPDPGRPPPPPLPPHRLHQHLACPVAPRHPGPAPPCEPACRPSVPPPAACGPAAPAPPAS